ncbi:heterokaryon incompatibility protein-domain-containing protein [Phyllosticta capitalensis]
MPSRYDLEPHIFRFQDPLSSRDHSWMINWDRVKSWLRKSPSVPQLDPIPSNFRLVDVEDRCVVQAPPAPFSYVCLSYTWGDTGKEYLATTKTIDSFKVVGCLSNPAVPKTIQDAIVAGQRLGEKYLWVDRLCILQDDDGPNGEKQEHIERMGQVYSHAFVTLAAVDGTDAGHGLHGVSGLKLRGDEYGEFYFLQTSTWVKRAWTYQEAILSPRLILFLAQDALLEDEQSLQTTNSRYLTKNFPLFHGMITYKEAVQSYTKRHLGDQNDAINAFSGACQHLFGDHQFGLSMAGFDDAMAWVAIRPRERRPSQSFHIFPSWSWASIKAPVSYPFNDPVVSVASWAFVKCDANGTSSMTYPIPRKVDGFRNRKPRVYIYQLYLATVACKRGLMPMTPSDVWSLEEDFEGFTTKFDTEDGFASKWPSYEDFWAACRGVNPGNSLNPQAEPLYFQEFSEEQRSFAAQPGRVLALSHSVTLNVTLRDGKQHGAHGADYIMHQGTTPVGIGTFDDPGRMQELSKHKIRYFALSISTSRFDVRDKTNFFQSFGGDLEVFGAAFGEEWSSYHRGNRACLQADVMNVIAIEETPEQPGVFRRIGFGIIMLDEWDKLELEKCSIILE